MQLQRDLRARVIIDDKFGRLGYVAGVDVGYEQGGKIARAAVAVLDIATLTLCAKSVARMPVTFPYVPGLLSFREIPVVLKVLRQLKWEPDVLLCDGQGYAHPRRFGFASHLGVLLDKPTIGVAKTRFIGEHAEPGPQRGNWTELTHQDEIIGAVLRSRARTKPLYISAGHRVSLASAIDIVMRCTTRYRLPETTRHAHRLASSK